MNELKRLIDAFGNQKIKQGIFMEKAETKTVESFFKYSEQAKQAILDYIEENYRRKDGR